jgi:hypothetical protein
VLEGELAGGGGPAALFIDRFGFGGFRGGYARVGRVGVGRLGAVGVWHRPYVARGAWYRGAAVGAAAVGAAAAGAYPYYGAACGYYPYPPRYKGLHLGHQEANASPGHRRVEASEQRHSVSKSR